MTPLMVHSPHVTLKVTYQNSTFLELHFSGYGRFGYTYFYYLPSDRKLALIFPFLLHAIILSLRFTFPERKNGQGRWRMLDAGCNNPHSSDSSSCIPESQGYEYVQYVKHISCRLTFILEQARGRGKLLGGTQPARNEKNLPSSCNISSFCFFPYKAC